MSEFGLAVVSVTLTGITMGILIVAALFAFLAARAARDSAAATKTQAELTAKAVEATRISADAATTQASVASKEADLRTRPWVGLKSVNYEPPTRINLSVLGKLAIDGNCGSRSRRRCGPRNGLRCLMMASVRCCQRWKDPALARCCPL